MEEKTLLKAVLVFPVRRKQVLLARKVQKIGAGCLNGYGGGIEKGESALDAAIRELKIESRLETVAGDYEKVAEVHFHNQKSDGSFFTCDCDVFLVRKWRGTPQSTREMYDPQWFSIARLPVKEMMPADKDWVPLIFAGWKIVVHAWYGPFQKVLLQQTKVKYVTSFD